jgi:ubiquinone biosynthesis protein COQ4
MLMTPWFVLPRFDPPRAARALAALLRDPDDLPQVFTLIEALSGTAPHRLLLRFQLTESGARLLRDRPDIVPLLSDRAWLRSLPDGSLGRAYLAFVEAEGISANGIRAASIEGALNRRRPGAFLYLHQRMRDTHDLWHALTGYQGDLFGEVSLLAFTLGQHWNSGVALIVGAALLRGHGTGVARMVYDGFKRGRAAAWLPAQEWESLLEVPLDTVRARLQLAVLPPYVPLRSNALRAQRMAPRAR